MSTSPGRTLLRRVVTAPVIRLLAPGWPDTGRRIVQRPVLESLLTEAVGGETPSAVLNAGCGEGLYSPTLRKFTNGAVLFEFDYASPTSGRGHDFHRFTASLDAIALQAGSMDLVLCTEVLEHVRNDEAAVSELRRVLSGNGRLVLSVPTPPAIFDPAHVREGYTLEDLRALLARHHLEIVNVQYSMYAVFQAVLRYWRPRRVPLGLIVGLAWLDRFVRIGKPMDVAVLAKPAMSFLRNAGSEKQERHV